MRRCAAVIARSWLLCAVLWVPAGAAAEEALPALADPVFDTAVCSTSPDSAAGGSSSSVVSSDTCRVLVQFRLPRPVAGSTVRRATLRAWYQGRSTSSSSFTGVGLHAFSPVADGWTEGVTWNTRPEVLGDPFAIFDAGATAPGTRVRFDVTEQVQAAQQDGGTFSFEIAAEPGSPSPVARWLTREGGAGFALELELDGASRPRPGELVGFGWLSFERQVWGLQAFDLESRTLRVTREIFAPQELSGLVVEPDTGDILVGAGYAEPSLYRLRTGVAAPLERVTHAGLLTAILVPVQGPSGELLVGQIGVDVSRVVAIDPATGAQRLVSEGSLLNSPLGAVLDPSGQLLLAVQDVGFGAPTPPAVVRVDLETGAQSVVSAGGLLGCPVAVAVGPTGSIYVGQHSFCSGGAPIVRIDPETGGQSAVSTPPFLDATGLLVEPSGHLIVGMLDWVNSGIGGALSRLDPETGDFTTLYETVDRIGGMAWAPDGAILFTSHDVWRSPGTSVRRLDLETGEVRTVVAIPAQMSEGARQLVALDAERRILMGMAHSSLLFRLDPRTGSQELVLDLDIAPRDVHHEPPQLAAIQFAFDGRLFGVVRGEPWTSGWSSELFEIDLEAKELRQVTGAAGITRMTRDAGGGLVGIRVLPGTAPAVVRIDPDLETVDVISEGGELRSPRSLAVAADGRVLIADPVRRAVIAVDPESGDQSLLPYWFTQGTAPWLVVASAEGRVFAGAPGLWEIDPSGARVVLASSTSPGPVVVLPRCADGFDNDGDGRVDWPADPGCTSPLDDLESVPACGLGAELALAVLLITRRRLRPRFPSAPLALGSRSFP